MLRGLIGNSINPSHSEEEGNNDNTGGGGQRCSASHDESRGFNVSGGINGAHGCPYVNGVSCFVEVGLTSLQVFIDWLILKGVNEQWVSIPTCEGVIKYCCCHSGGRNWGRCASSSDSAVGLKRVVLTECNLSALFSIDEANTVNRNIISSGGFPVDTKTRTGICRVVSFGAVGGCDGAVGLEVCQIDLEQANRRGDNVCCGILSGGVPFCDFTI